MNKRKHDDAHRPMQGRGQRGNRLARPANWGGAELIEHTLETCSACCMNPCRCAPFAGMPGTSNDEQEKTL
jgi:hypothetical protein